MRLEAHQLECYLELVVQDVLLSFWWQGTDAVSLNRHILLADEQGECFNDEPGHDDVLDDRDQASTGRREAVVAFEVERQWLPERILRGQEFAEAFWHV